MSAGGLYSLATIGAKHVIDHATPIVLNALGNIPNLPRDTEHWCFSDMGCADGGTSLDLWRNVFNAIRNNDSTEWQAASMADIQIVYSDQARNDFNALIQILHGLTDFTSYLPEFSNLQILESGSSFYLPILPRESLHLGFSATAMHWLSTKPCNIKNHVHMVGATGADLDKFSEQAASDWQTILLHRARELKRGGKLVLVNFARDEQGRYLGNTGGINMFDNFNKIWRSFLADGRITSSEYDLMTLPQYYNTVEEFSAPLLDKNSPVYQSGLRLTDIKTAIITCPFADDYKNHHDAARFAREYIPTIRSWNESIFYGGLSTTRSAEDRHQLIEEYYAEYQRQVAENPQGHGMDYVHAYMTIERI
ncbi:hypothetical protein AB833_16020 [Chromatiales bacterium (ex Bugula neritina AB1)]|nr:hypothetical protein AB833_16020 [Chromatiales bacterium (ex Bugula neritina AB1)]